MGGVGGQSSFHVQAKSEILGEDSGVGHLSMSRPNLKLCARVKVGLVSHLSMPRPNLKLCARVRVGRSVMSDWTLPIIKF